MVGAFYSLQGFQNDFVKFCSFCKHKEKGVEVKGGTFASLEDCHQQKGGKKALILEWEKSSHKMLTDFLAADLHLGLKSAFLSMAVQTCSSNSTGM